MIEAFSKDKEYDYAVDIFGLPEANGEDRPIEHLLSVPPIKKEDFTKKIQKFFTEEDKSQADMITLAC